LRLTPHKTRVPKDSLRLFLDGARTDGLSIRKQADSVRPEIP
jgi:hypothetical protein